MAFWAKARRARPRNPSGSDDFSAPGPEMGNERRMGRAGINSAGGESLERGSCVGKRIIAVVFARSVLVALVGFGILTIALAFVSSNAVLNVSSLTVLENRRNDAWHLELALRRSPLFDVQADWKTEATVLSGAGIICPADTRLSSGTARYEVAGGSLRLISAEWLRRCLDVGPVELFAEWQVRYSIGALTVKMHPYRITQVVSWETVKAGAGN